MKRTWPILAITLATGLLGAYLVACAQERVPLYPPPVLPKDATSASKPKPDAAPMPTFPNETLPLIELPKLSPPPEPKRGVVQTGGVASPPKFPSGLIVPEPEASTKSPLLPELESKPLPLPEPTKALIVDPPTKEIQKPKAATLDVPIPPPPVLLPGPSVVLPLSIEPPAPAQPTKRKAFLPIRTNWVEPSPVSQPVAPQPSLSALPLAAPTGNALASVQAPSVTLAKRGAATLRAGESQAYQIIIRNLGPTPAQEIRIEDDIPAGARIISADPMPTLQGTKAVWILPNLGVNGEQTLRLLLQSLTDMELTNRVSVQVAAANQATTIAARKPRLDGPTITIQLVAPKPIVVGKPAVFEIRVANQSEESLTGLVLHSTLPEGLVMRVNAETGMRDEREIKGDVDETILPGTVKTLRMPANAVKPGRYTLAVKVTARGGIEASSSVDIEIAGGSLQLQQAPTTRMFLGRDGDLRIDVMNLSGKPMRNVTVVDRLPEGLDFVAASERGLYQANSRMVYWQFAEMPAGASKALIVRVHGNKAGQLQNVVQVRGDGATDMNSIGIIHLEGTPDLNVRVTARDQLVEVGNEMVYEIHVANPGSAAATNVQVQLLFPPGMTPKDAQGGVRFALDRQSVVFEPLATLAPQGQATFRVSAVAQPTADRDQRVRFAVVSDQVRVPIHKEISTIVVPR